MMELRFTVKFEALMRREGLPEATHDHFLEGRTAGTVGTTSSWTYCSSTTSIRKVSCSSPRARGTKGSCWDCR